MIHPLIIDFLLFLPTFHSYVNPFCMYMNVDATYRTRRHRVRGAVKGLMGKKGFAGEKSVPIV